MVDGISPFPQGEEDAPAPPGPQGRAEELSGGDCVPEGQGSSPLCKSLLGKGQTETSAFI